MYYIGNMMFDPNYLTHHGVKGQVHGIRRYQNEDGSLTPEGREHYGIGQGKRSTKGLDIYQKKYVRKMNRAQKKIGKFENKRVKPGDIMDTCAGTFRYTAEEARDYNKYYNERIQKHMKKFDYAKEKLDLYNSTSEENKKKLRNQIRKARAGAIGAAALGATAAGMIIAGYNYRPIVKSETFKSFGKTTVTKILGDPPFSHDSNFRVATVSTLAAVPVSVLYSVNALGNRYQLENTIRSDRKSRLAEKMR